jgi:signal transduction histidine kinase
MEAKEIHRTAKRKEEESHYIDPFYAVVNDFALSLNYLETEDEVVWYVAKELCPRLDLVDCVIYLLDQEKGVLQTKSAFGYKNPRSKKIVNPLEISLGQGIVGTVGMNGIPIIIKDTRKDGRYIHDIQENLSEITIPIVYENKVLGVIDSEHPKLNYFNDKHLLALTTIAAMAATRIMNIRNQEELKRHQNNLEKEIELKTKELQNTITSLNKSNRDLESFAYAISHDLREPLRTIRGFLQLIKNNKEDTISTESKEFMDFVMDGATRMNDMMEGLLEYSKLDYSNDAHQNINMNDLLLMIQAGLRASIEEKKAVIYIDELPSIYGNKTQLIQLFQNLIANSIKFNKKDIAPHIKINSSIRGSILELTISDNGIGIPPLMQKHIFKLFYKGEKKQNSGSGIGLALCQRIIECHKGSIRVESEEEKGTRFYINLPLSV